jgi:hypothetical protein
MATCRGSPSVPEWAKGHLTFRTVEATPPGNRTHLASALPHQHHLRSGDPKSARLVVLSLDPGTSSRTNHTTNVPRSRAPSSETCVKNSRSIAFMRVLDTSRPFRTALLYAMGEVGHYYFHRMPSGHFRTLSRQVLVPSRTNSSYVEGSSHRQFWNLRPTAIRRSRRGLPRRREIRD